MPACLFLIELSIVTVVDFIKRSFIEPIGFIPKIGQAPTGIGLETLQRRKSPVHCFPVNGIRLRRIASGDRPSLDDLHELKTI